MCLLRCARFVLDHVGFLNLFKGFHFSHLNYGFSLACNLIVYRLFIVDPDSYFSVTWSTWAFALVLLYAPFAFNCLALDGSEVARDVSAWSGFIGGTQWQQHFGEQSIYFNHACSTNELLYII